MKSEPVIPSFLPLYEQIRQLITCGLADGEWQPGTVVHTEMALASRFQVSQGKVRKAIDERERVARTRLSCGFPDGEAATGL